MKEMEGLKRQGLQELWEVEKSVVLAERMVQSNEKNCIIWAAEAQGKHSSNVPSNGKNYTHPW